MLANDIRALLSAISEETVKDSIGREYRLLLAREKREFNIRVDLNPRERGNIVRYYKGTLKALANVVLPGDLEGLIRLSLRSSISGSPTANRSKETRECGGE